MKLSLVLCAALSLASPAFAQGSGLSTPGGSLTIRGGANASSLFDVASAYANLTGRPLVVTDAHAKALEQARVGLLADVDVPPDAVHDYAQALLALGGFVVVDFVDTLEVVDWRTAVEESRAIDVDASELAALGDQQAVYVRTTVACPGLEARQLATSLSFLGRPKLPTPSFQAAGDFTLEVSGSAGSVLHAIAWLNELSDPAAEVREPEWEALFPPAARGLAVEPLESLAGVLEQYAALTGRHFWVDEGLQRRMKLEHTGLLVGATIPAERVHAFVEGLLLAHGYAISVQRGPAPSLHAIAASPQSFVPRPLLVQGTLAESARLRDHPATIFAAALTLDRVEARQMTTSLRTLFTDTAVEGMLAVGDHSMFVQTSGAKLAFQLEMLRGLNGEASADTTLVARLLPVAPPSADMVLADARPSLLVLLTAYSRLTGRAVIVGQAEEQLLRGLLAPEGTPAVVPAGEVQAVVEAALAVHGVRLDAILVDPPVLGVCVPKGRHRGGPRMVAVDDLDALASQGSLLVGCVLSLQKLEARRLTTSLRPLFTSVGPIAVIAVENDALLIIGGVATVRELVSKVREYDAKGELPAGDAR